MIRWIVDKPFADGLRYVEGACVSSDAKPTTGIITGSKLTEADTGDVYMFYEDSTTPAWTKIAAGWVDPGT